MRGVYTSSLKCTSVAAAKTLAYWTVPADAVMELISVFIGSPDNDTNEQLEALIQKITTLGTPSKTDVTPAPAELGDQAASITTHFNVTASEPTFTSNTEWGYQSFATLGGYIYEPVPEERPIFSPGTSHALRLIGTPGSSSSFIVKVSFREIGG